MELELPSTEEPVATQRNRFTDEQQLRTFHGTFTDLRQLRKYHGIFTDLQISRNCSRIVMITGHKTLVIVHV